MRFTVLVSLVVLFLGFWQDIVISNFVSHMTHLYQEQFITQPHIFLNADASILEEFCPIAKDDLLIVSQIIQYFYIFILVSSVGYATSIVQKLTVYKLNDNADLRAQELLIETCIFIASILFVILKYQNHKNPLISDICAAKVEFTEE